MRRKVYYAKIKKLAKIEKVFMRDTFCMEIVKNIYNRDEKRLKILTIQWTTKYNSILRKIN